MPAGGLIECQGLTKQFGSVRAVDGLSFRAEPGRVTGFLGPNGSGKTTTLRMILGLVRPTTGLATIGGARYQDLREPLRQVGAVLDTAGFYPPRSARDHLAIGARLLGMPESAADAALAWVGLEGQAKRKVGGFSLGMRQRLAMASALLASPDVLLLDEPANGLDPAGVHWLRGFLRSFAATGRTVLLSSHVLAEMAQTVDEVVVIHRGRLVAQAPLAGLLAMATQGVRVRSPEASRLVGLLSGAGVSSRWITPDTIIVESVGSEWLGGVMADQRIPVFEMVAVTPSLEEVFLKLTGSAGE